MKIFAVTLSFAAVFFAGCAAQHYVISLSNGHRVIAAQKPHLEGFNFVFLDLQGRTNSVPSEYIRAIAPFTGTLTNAPGK